MLLRDGDGLKEQEGEADASCQYVLENCSS